MPEEVRNTKKLKRYKPTAFKAKDSHYDKAAADFAVAFIENLCHTKGTWAGKPFLLLDWQEQIIRDLFGILKPNGYRQFNTAYVEIPKKNGKSELAAAIALLLCCGDGEERAEVYGCAADRQQASIVFEVAADMVRMCPALSKRVKILASQKRIIYAPTNSFYQVLSAEAYSKHGFNIHGVVFDELHTQPNRKLFDVMTKGSGDARMQPLYFLITTAGTDTHSICYETHQKAMDILEGRKDAGTLPSNGAMVKSIVTSTMSTEIAKAYGVKMFEALTGFKNICGRIPFLEKNGYTYLFGYEESVGYASCPQIRDKDGISAGMLVAEAAAYYKKQGKTLWQVLEEIFEQYGFYNELEPNIVLKGVEGAARIGRMMTWLRGNLPAQVAGFRVTQVIDYKDGYEDIPASNVLRFFLDNGSWFAVRPSGTEPKIKFYFYSRQESAEAAARVNEAIRDEIFSLINSVQ